MKYIVIIFSLISSIVVSQSKNIEQLAFDYFIEEILAKDYVNEKSVYFSGYTQNENKLGIGGLFAYCFESEKPFVDFIYNFKPKKTQPKIIIRENHPKTKFLKKFKKRKLEIEVYTSVKYDDYYLVYINVYKQSHFVNHYLIRLKNHKVIDFCFEGEVI
ncbi:hypothetical protein [Pontimicrobium aquaticum]|uniref:Uncharacterized protein n=1 Tax=Pontimicrobium aquaticum TaxID=2565367 RepID=A0A4U0EYK4_9FLAO|nr:hypothetical protein [Pontimicrobium aquaticum]TJY36484.1 hypothetical protein E5167_07435 [Pontimicrobium aquaticum]